MTDVHTTPSAQATESEQKNTTTVTVEARPSEPNVTASEAAAAEPNNEATQPADDAGETRRRSGTPYSQRIGELTREKYELKARVAELEARYGSGAPSPAPEKAEQEQGPPKLDAYNSYEEWVEAVADYRAEKRFTELQRQGEERAAQERERRAAESRRAAYEKAVATIEDRYPDYHDVTAEMPVTRLMAEFILEHDKGPDIAYYLGKNPDEAMRIANLSPVKQGFELAKLEAKLVTPASQVKAATSAPEPINPVRPKERAPAADPSKMSMAEYANWRKQQMRAQRNS